MVTEQKAITDHEPRPNPDEVAEARWSAPEALGVALRATPWAFSPWLVEQAQEMRLYAGTGVGAPQGEAAPR